MLNRFDVPLLSSLVYDVRVGPHDHQRRPIVELEGVPDVELAVIDAGVLHVVADHGLTQHVHCLFLVELRGMYPNKGDFWEILKFGLQLLELSEYMNAIDAAASPEVYDQELAFQLVLHGQRLIVDGVQPFEVVAIPELGLEGVSFFM